MVVTKFHNKRLPAEHARNLYHLSVALLHEDKSIEAEETEAEDALLEAELYLKRRCPEADSFNTDSSYDKFIYIFYR